MWSTRHGVSEREYLAHCTVRRNVLFEKIYRQWTIHPACAANKTQYGHFLQTKVNLPPCHILPFSNRASMIPRRRVHTEAGRWTFLLGLQVLLVLGACSRRRPYCLRRQHLHAATVLRGALLAIHVPLRFQTKDCRGRDYLRPRDLHPGAVLCTR